MAGIFTNSDWVRKKNYPKTFIIQHRMLPKNLLLSFPYFFLSKHVVENCINEDDRKSELYAYVTFSVGILYAMVCG